MRFENVEVRVGGQIVKAASLEYTLDPPPEPYALGDIDVSVPLTTIGVGGFAIRLDGRRLSRRRKRLVRAVLNQLFRRLTLPPPYDPKTFQRWTDGVQRPGP